MNERDYKHKIRINQIIRTVMANKKPFEIEGILYYQDQIIEIADLIRADEREACAMVAEEHMREREGASFGIGAAIRARGNK